MAIADRVEGALNQYVTDFLERPPVTEPPVIVLAVSGGPDSLCLLHTICHYDLYPRDALVVGHLDHGLRVSSGEEANFVLKFSEVLGVQGFTDKKDISSLAQSQGLSLEEAGRQARYEFLAQLARRFGAGYVLTGHNADDQVETILMHFLRGAGMEGLRGMQLAGPMPGAADITLLRPLLRVSRAEIDEYCRKHNLNPVHDETNQDTTFYRNRLRHELIPFLEGYNPNIHDRMQQLGVVISDENKLMEELVDQAWLDLIVDQDAKWLKLDLLMFRKLSVAVQRRILRKAVLTINPGLRDVGFRTIEQARRIAMTADAGTASSLPEGINMVVGYGDLSISGLDTSNPTDDFPQLEAEVEIFLPIPGDVDLARGWRLQTELVQNLDTQSILENDDRWQAYLSLDALDDVSVRTRRVGERFRPLGMAEGTVKISHMMIDRKIPVSLRKQWPIVASGNHALWVVGHLIDERVKVSGRSSNIVRFRAVREVDDG